jgi:hypothetical protein
MSEALGRIILKILQSVIEKKHGQITFSIADGKIVDVDLHQRKVGMKEIDEAQKN